MRGVGKLEDRLPSRAAAAHDHAWAHMQVGRHGTYAPQMKINIQILEIVQIKLLRVIKVNSYY